MQKINLNAAHSPSPLERAGVRLSGYLYALLSSASFGLIPLFAVPVLHEGMVFSSVIFYRFLFASIAIGIFLLLTKQSFRITWKDVKSLVVLALLYDASSLLLLWGYSFMGSGVATTLHFIYPVLTTVIMMAFFHEKGSFRKIIAVALAVFGVACLSYSNPSGKFSLFGVIIVLLSGLAYALYLIAVNQLPVKHLTGLRLTFYVFVFGEIFLLLILQFIGGLEPVHNWNTAGNLILLALIPTVVSNLTLVQAIKHIGSTMTSIFGALEPVTAVIVGVSAFDEPMTMQILLGIVFIVSAVTITVLHRPGSSKVST